MKCFLSVTHQNRSQGQRELFTAGASLDEIKHFLHCLHDAQTESHIAILCEKLVT